MITFENQIIENTIFVNVLLQDIIYQNVVFKNCTFQKATFKKVRVWACFYENCTFQDCDLSVVHLFNWGGAMSDSVLNRCKLGHQESPSYIVRTSFNNCKIKRLELFTYLLADIKFVGKIEDVRINLFDSKEISQYNSPENAKIVEERIKQEIGVGFNSNKAILKNIDFSRARFSFIDFNDCEIQGLIPPNDHKHIFINENFPQIIRNVLTEIEQNWDDFETKNWAISCIKKFENKKVAFISITEFATFENLDFAEKLFIIIKNKMSENMRQSIIELSESIDYQKVKLGIN